MKMLLVFYFVIGIVSGAIAVLRSIGIYRGSDIAFRRLLAVQGRCGLFYYAVTFLSRLIVWPIELYFFLRMRW